MVKKREQLVRAAGVEPQDDGERKIRGRGLPELKTSEDLGFNDLVHGEVTGRADEFGAGDPPRQIRP